MTKELLPELFREDVEHKLTNTALYMRYRELVDQGQLSRSEKRLAEISGCRKMVKYAVDEGFETKKVLYQETCNDKFCSACQSAKAIKDSLKVLAVSSVMVKREKLEVVFMTLTVPNVTDLKAGRVAINTAFKRMMEYKELAFVKGYVTKFEVTYSHKRQDFHPHLHVMLFVEKSYFRKGSKDYLTNDKLLAIWRRATKDETINQVDLRAVKGNLDHAVVELSKYVSKTKDILVSNEVFLEFERGLSYAKILRFGKMCEPYALAYDVDDYGFFKSFLPREKRAKFVSKYILNWQYKDKTYSHLEKDLTQEEKALLRSMNVTRTRRGLASDIEKLGKQVVKAEGNVEKAREKTDKAKMRLERAKEKGDTVQESRALLKYETALADSTSKERKYNRLRKKLESLIFLQECYQPKELTV